MTPEPPEVAALYRKVNESLEALDKALLAAADSPDGTEDLVCLTLKDLALLREHASDAQKHLKRFARQTDGRADELSRKLMAAEAEVARLRQEKADKRKEKNRLLRRLVTTPTALPRPAGFEAVQHDLLHQRFLTLKAEQFWPLAEKLDRSGRGTQYRDAYAYQGLLARNLLCLGGDLLAEALLEQTAGDLEPPRQRLVHLLRKALALKEDDPLLADLGDLTGQALAWLLGLLTAAPTGGLLIPQKGERFDDDRHAVLPGHEGGGRILDTLFPGYVVWHSPPRVVEKAQVLLLRRLQPDSPPP